MIKGVSLDNLGPFITSGGRDTGAGPPEPPDSTTNSCAFVRKSDTAFECCGAAAAGALPAHCRCTARACAIRSAEPVYCAESSTRALRAWQGKVGCERRGELREDDEVPNESRCPPRRRLSRRRRERQYESRSGSRQCHPRCPRPRAQVPRQRLAIVSLEAGARAPATHSAPPTAISSSRCSPLEKNVADSGDDVDAPPPPPPPPSPWRWRRRGGVVRPPALQQEPHLQTRVCV